MITLKVFLAIVVSIPSIDSYNINSERVFKEAIDKVHIKPVASSTCTPPVTKKVPFEGPRNYWFNSKIHTFGNTGLFGAFHAAMAPFATLLIDEIAYEGENVRNKLARHLRCVVKKPKAKIVDMCCGVGMSTRALSEAFHDASSLVAVDTSPEMIAMANFLNTDNPVAKVMKKEEPTFTPKCDICYNLANAEKTDLPSSSIDLVTIMYAFHEAPYLGRYRILREARRLLAPGSTLAVIDISTNYKPSPSMLAGEPYVLEYQENIIDQLQKIQGFTDYKYTEVVEGHVGFWLLTRKD